MRHHARIVDGSPAGIGDLCDLVHTDIDGHLEDRRAVARLILNTSIGLRYVDVCDAHDDAVGADLARWSHAVEGGQSALETQLDSLLTDVLSDGARRR